MTEPDLRALLPKRAGPVLHLLGHLRVEVDGARWEIPEGSKRLVAYLAVNEGWADRRTVAGTLWPLGTDARAAGNLRSAVWRLRGVGIDVLAADRCGLRLRADIVIDVHLVADWAARLVEGTATDADLNVRTWSPALLNLLPGWFEEWAVLERERLRQRVLHGLEALSRHLVRAGRTADAIEAAAGVVAIDPLRESGQRTLVEALLAAGHPAAAERIFRGYGRLVVRELHVFPGQAFARLAADARRDEAAQPLRISG